jgi:hypothetical protein
MKLKFLIILFFGISFNSFSQKFDTLSEQDKADFKQKAIEKIKLLGFTFEIVASTKNQAEKNRFIESILPSFVLKPRQATIEVTSKNGAVSYEIEVYLREKLKNYKNKYAIVDIEFVSFDIKELIPHRTEPNCYYLEYTFAQKFCGSIDGKKDKEGLINYSYCDITTKTGSFIIKKENTILGSKWKMLFESIYVKDIKIL